LRLYRRANPDGNPRQPTSEAPGQSIRSGAAYGERRLADRVHDNFANIVWSRDSDWIIFTTPFAPRGIWLTRPDEPTLEWISFGRKHATSLLCDASDLIS
jgi:hypothetical protein